MNIIKYQLELNNREYLFFYAPEGDSTTPGTLAGLQEGTWHLKDIKYNQGDIFVDIGCNVGIISLIVARLNPQAQIFAFDPNPIVIECLNKSIKENNIKNIHSFNYAVGVFNGESEFITYSENETCLIQKELADNFRAVSFQSKILSVDEVFDSILKKKRIKFLKVDIETGEFDLFDHLFEKRQDILDSIEYLHLEIHPFDMSFPKSKKLKEMTDSKFGKRVFY